MELEGMPRISPLSVVIPTYNNAETLMRCLQALAKQSFPLEAMEVLVMVDGSTDETLAAYYSGVCLTVFYKLHPELKDYLVERGMISAQQKDLRPLKSFLARTILNRWTVHWFETCAKTLNRRGTRTVSEFLFWRLFGYYQRKGVEDGLQNDYVHH